MQSDATPYQAAADPFIFRSAPLVQASQAGPLLLPAGSSLDTAHALYVQEQSLVDIEMPGQHVSGDEPVPDSTVYVERISSSVVVVRRHSSSFRRLGFIGSDGRTRFFIVQVGVADGDLLCMGCHRLPRGQVHVCCLSCVVCTVGSLDVTSHAARAKCMSAVCGVVCMDWAALTQHHLEAADSTCWPAGFTCCTPDGQHWHRTTLNPLYSTWWQRWLDPSQLSAQCTEAATAHSHAQMRRC